MSIRSILKRIFSRPSKNQETETRRYESTVSDPTIRTTVGKYIAPNTDVHEMHRGEHWHGEG
jgi:hypothetical protein